MDQKHPPPPRGGVGRGEATKFNCFGLRKAWGGKRQRRNCGRLMNLPLLSAVPVLCASQLQAEAGRAQGEWMTQRAGKHTHKSPRFEACRQATPRPRPLVGHLVRAQQRLLGSEHNERRRRGKRRGAGDERVAAGPPRGRGEARLSAPPPPTKQQQQHKHKRQARGSPAARGAEAAEGKGEARRPLAYSLLKGRAGRGGRR